MEKLDMESVLVESEITVVSRPVKTDEVDDKVDIDRWQKEIDEVVLKLGDLKNFVSENADRVRVASSNLNGSIQASQLNKLFSYVMANIVPTNAPIVIFKEKSDELNEESDPGYLECDSISNYELSLKTKGFVRRHPYYSRGDEVGLTDFIGFFHKKNTKGKYAGKFTSVVILERLIKIFEDRSSKSNYRTAGKALSIFKRLKDFVEKYGDSLKTLSSNNSFKEDRLILSINGMYYDCSEKGNTEGGYYYSHDGKVASFSRMDDWNPRQLFMVLKARYELPGLLDKGEVFADNFARSKLEIIKEFNDKFAKEIVLGKTKSYK